MKLTKGSTMLLRVLLVVLSVAAVVVRGSDFIHSDRYQIWAADLKPGFIIRKQINEGQNCYCKVPWESSSSSSSSSETTSFTFTPTGTLTASSSSSSKFDYHFLTRAPVNGT